MQNHNIYTIFTTHFPAQRDTVCIETPDGLCYTYADMEAESARYAALLSACGVQAGDRVAVQVDKSPQAVFLYLACQRGGFVYLPLNTAYTEHEVAYFLGNAQPAAIVCRPEGEATLRKLATAHQVPHVFTLDACGGGSLYAQSHGASQVPDFPPVMRQADDVAVILYTSGTTGQPKGAMITHANLAANGYSLARAWGFSAKDVLLHALPLFHIHGLFVACHCALLSGARMIFMARFDAASVVQYLPRATVFMGVPTFYTRLLAQTGFDRETCAQMRLFTSGSAPLLPQTFTAFQARTGHTILERYGMTETGMNTSNPLEGERRAGTVGLPLPGVSVRIVDAQGQPVATGEVGQLQVRGDNVFKGYWQMPEKSAEEFTADGYFRTGDQATLDADGYIAIVGRDKDMVITGGYNVYPKEIERLIDTLEGVVESAVIGLPHPDFGEGVAAVVVRVTDPDASTGSLPDERAIIAALKDRLAGYKVPKRVFFADALPRNTMGKVQKNRLREQFADTFRID